MIKIINYKPYEYELLQEKLSKWGEKGYQTKDLSFISFFKKTDSPVYYQIDSINPKENHEMIRLLMKQHL